MKKIIAVILLLVCAGAVFAQQAPAGEEKAPSAPKEKKNAIGMDLFPLFKGLAAIDNDADTGFFCMSFSYERLLVPHFSIGGQLDMYPGQLYDLNYFYFGMSTFARFYPMSGRFDKFFLGAGIGFNTHVVDGKTKVKDGGGPTGMTAALKAGYKLVFSKAPLFIEPSMSYVLSKMGPSEVGPLGWQGGLRFGAAF